MKKPRLCKFTSVEPELKPYWPPTLFCHVNGKEMLPLDPTLGSCSPFSSLSSMHGPHVAYLNSGNSKSCFVPSTRHAVFRLPHRTLLFFSVFSVFSTLLTILAAQISSDVTSSRKPSLICPSLPPCPHAEQVTTPLPGPTARPLAFPFLHKSHRYCSYLTSCLSFLPGLGLV